MRTPRDQVGHFLGLADDETTTGTPPPVDDIEDDEFLDDRERRRLHAVAEAEERGLWCFITRQDDAAWHRLTRLERNSMADAINRAHSRRR